MFRLAVLMIGLNLAFATPGQGQGQPPSDRQTIPFTDAMEMLATACGLSRFHLVHAFTKETGLSPHAYQVHVRIERSRNLLQIGIPPAAAAASLGFADQSHFTRHFKRIMHVTPTKYASLGPVAP